MAPERIILTQDEVIMGFAASCIEWTAKELQCDYREVFERMDKVGLIDHYIIPCYDVLHTESRKNIIKDVIETLSNWEAESKRVC